MKLFGIQMDIAWEDRAANYRKVKNLLETVDIPPDSLIVLPEMFSSGYSFNVKSIAESDESESLSVLTRFAVEYKSYFVGGIVTCRCNGLGRNQAAVIDPYGSEIARYTKLHPFSYAGESQYYAAGRQLVYFKAGPFKVAPFICYDLRFPEIFRVASKNGVNLFTVLANWPEVRESHWIALLKARAIENQSYVIGVNRCGKDPALAYMGRSLIIGPKGNVIADGGNNEGVIEGELYPEEIYTYRKSFPVLKDMRDDFLFSEESIGGL